jgi:hypothetical protein
MAVGTRRRFVALSSMVVTATLATSLMVSSVAGAAGPMTGRLFDPITYATVGGVTVTAEATDGSGSFTGSSAADGTFSVQVGDAQYLVGIDGAAAGYGSGWLQFVSDVQSPVIVADKAAATPFSARELGDLILTEPIYAGVVVNGKNGTPVANAGVQLLGPAGTVASTFTRADGSFRFATFGTGFSIAIDGSAVGFETGVIGTGANEAFGRPVVADPALTASLSPGDLGAIALDPIVEPPASLRPGRVQHLRLTSRSAGSITVTFHAPRRGGKPVDYSLTCSTGRRGQTVTRVIRVSGQTVSGFSRGHNICKLTSRNAAGQSHPVVQVVRVR